MPPLSTPGSAALPYQLLIVGGGPAGVAVLVRAARLNVLSNLLGGSASSPSSSSNPTPPSSGVCIISTSACSQFGRGALSTYLIQSNTHASAFVDSITSDKPDSLPSENCSGNPFLKELRKSSVGKSLIDIGSNVAPLEIVGNWLGEVGSQIKKNVEESSMSCIRHSTTVQYINMTTSLLVNKPSEESDGGNLLYEVNCRDNLTGQIFVLYSRQIVMATGGKQVIPKDIFNDTISKKVLKGDYCLTRPGLDELTKRLEAVGGSEYGTKVVIVGGSHSAFSVCWLLLNRVYESFEEKKSDGEVVMKKRNWQFNANSIIMLHRSPIRVFYNSKKEADLDSYPTPPSTCHKLTGQYNTFGGLRGDAKGLYGRVVKGREERVKMHRVHGTAGGRAVAKKCYEETPIVIWCCGYVTNTVPITTDLNPIELSSLRAKFNSQGQKVDSTGETVDPNIAPTPPPAKSTGSNSSPNTNGSNTGRISPAIPVPELATRHKKEVNLLYDGNQVDVDYEAKVLQESSANPEGVPLPGVYGVGLGWGLRAVFKDGTKDGSSGRMDGYGIYLKRAATSILGNVIRGMGGDSGRVFGEGNDNWDERQKALLKKFGDARERRLSDSPTRSASKSQLLLNSPKANTKGEEKKECSPVRRNISTAPSSPMPNRGKSQTPPDEASTPVANNRKKSIASSSKKKDKEKEKKKEAEEKKDAEVTTAKKKEEKKKKEEENKEKEKEREETNNSSSSSPNKPPSTLTELQKQATVKRLSTPSTSSRPSTSHAALDSVPTPVVTKKMTEEQTQATVRRLSTAKKVEVVEGKEKKSKKSFKSDAELLKSVNRLATVVKKEVEQTNAEKEKEDQPTQPTLYKTDTGSNPNPNPSHETATKTNKKTKKKKRVRPDLPPHTPPRSPPEEGEVVAAPILASTRSDTSESSFQSCNSSLPPTRPTSSEMPESKSGNVNVKEKGRTTPLPNNGWFNTSDGGGEKDAKVYQNLTVEVDNNGKKEKSNGGKKEKEKEKEKNNLPPLFSPIKQSKKGGKQEPPPSYNSSNYAEAPPPYTPENYQPKSVPASPSNGIWVPGGGAATAPSREQKEAFEKYDAMYQKRSNLYTKLKTNAVKAACSGGGGSGISESSSGRRHTSVGGSIGFGGGVTAANGGYGTRNSNNSKVALMTRKIEMEFSMSTFSGTSRKSFSSNRNSGERIHSSKLQLTVPGSKFSSSIGGMGARGRRHTALGFGAGSSAKGDSGVGAMGNKSFAAHVNNVKASRLNKR